MRILVGMILGADPVLWGLALLGWAALLLRLLGRPRVAQAVTLLLLCTTAFLLASRSLAWGLLVPRNLVEDLLGTLLMLGALGLWAERRLACSFLGRTVAILLAGTLLLALCLPDPDLPPRAGAGLLRPWLQLGAAGTLAFAGALALPGSFGQSRSLPVEALLRSVLRWSLLLFALVLAMDAWQGPLDRGSLALGVPMMALGALLHLLHLPEGRGRLASLAILGTCLMGLLALFVA